MLFPFTAVTLGDLDNSLHYFLLLFVNKCRPLGETRRGSMISMDETFIGSIDNLLLLKTIETHIQFLLYDEVHKKRVQERIGLLHSSYDGATQRDDGEAHKSSTVGVLLLGFNDL